MAIEIAVQAHRGQIDKAGALYVLHPLRVMFAVTGEAERIVAMLHDVVEDCPDWTLDRIAGLGFAPEVIAGIDAVTRRKGEVYRDFIARADRNPVGRAVKIADLHDNCDLSRHETITDADLSRLQRYHAALQQLA